MTAKELLPIITELVESDPQAKISVFDYMGNSADITDAGPGGSTDGPILALDMGNHDADADQPSILG